MRYDAFGNLEYSTQPISVFTYDYEGKRKSMTTSNGTTYFYYSGDKVVYETDANNNIIIEYSYSAQGNLMTMTKNGITYYYIINAHGDITALTDASGNVVAQYSYDAWGNILSQTGTMASSNPYRYAGYRYDETTGLYYLMARYYDANVGRFITRDAFHGYEEVPKSLNLYVYVLNNPGRYLDSTGYDAEDIGRTYKQIPTVRGVAISAGIRSAAGVGGVGAAYAAYKAGKKVISKVLSAIRKTSKIELQFSNKLSPAQWVKQYTGRGWTKDSIQSVINKPYTKREAINRTTGNKSTVYYNKDGSYVIRDNVTKKIVQISDRKNPNWKPDSSIINPYKPKK